MQRSSLSEKTRPHGVTEQEWYSYLNNFSHTHFFIKRVTEGLFFFRRAMESQVYYVTADELIELIAATPAPPLLPYPPHIEHQSLDSVLEQLLKEL